jgi:hypothetical protein
MLPNFLPPLLISLFGALPPVSEITLDGAHQATRPEITYKMDCDTKPYFFRMVRAPDPVHGARMVMVEAELSGKPLDPASLSIVNVKMATLVGFGGLALSCSGAQSSILVSGNGSAGPVIFSAYFFNSRLDRLVLDNGSVILGPAH